MPYQGNNNGFATVKQLNFNSHGLQPVVNNCADTTTAKRLNKLLFNPFRVAFMLPLFTTGCTGGYQYLTTSWFSLQKNKLRKVELRYGREKHINQISN